MPQDWDIDMGRWNDGHGITIYATPKTIVFSLPLSGHYRIAEITRYKPKMIRQSMNKFRDLGQCIRGWDEEPIFFFPWRDARDFPIREARKRPRKHRPPKGGEDAP